MTGVQTCALPIWLCRSLTASSWQTFLMVRFPFALPHLFSGMKIAVTMAFIGIIVGEFISAKAGLGYYILYNSRSYHHNEAFVGVLLLAGFGVGFELLVNWTTQHFMPWYRRDEKAS